MMIRIVIGLVERMRFLRLPGWLGVATSLLGDLLKLLVVVVVVVVRAPLVNCKHRRTNPMSPLVLSAFIALRGIRR
jgi:hypothetical protein